MAKTISNILVEDRYVEDRFNNTCYSLNLGVLETTDVTSLFEV